MTNVDQVIVDTAAKLSLVEVGLGALVHGLKIPFGGHLLSLNQGFFLCRLVKKTRNVEGARRFPMYVSSISALLKSLSPAGDKLGPMVSISAQGAFFNLPLLFLGPNRIAVLLGMALMSIWAFLQPLVTLYLFFGNSIFAAGSFYLEKLQKNFGVGPDQVVKVLFVAVAIKAMASVIIGWVVFSLTEERLIFWDQKILSLSEKFNLRLVDSKLSQLSSDKRNISAQVLKDLTRPLFLTSMILMSVFFYFSEGDLGRTIWLSLRPLGVAVIFFYFSRSFLLLRLARKMALNESFPRFGRLFYETVMKISLRQGDKSYHLFLNGT